VTSDDHRGLVAAVKRHFQGTSWQRCQVHYTGGLLSMVGITKRAAPAEGIRAVFAAQTGEEARRLAGALAGQWRPTHRQVAEHIEECFACYTFPPAHRPRLRTTNGLERLNKEIKRRIRVVRSFPNRAACLRLATASVGRRLCLRGPTGHVPNSQRTGSPDIAIWTSASYGSGSAIMRPRR